MTPTPKETPVDTTTHMDPAAQRRAAQRAARVTPHTAAYTGPPDPATIAGLNTYMADRRARLTATGDTGRAHTTTPARIARDRARHTP